MLEGIPLDVGVDVGQAAAEVGAQHREQRLHLKNVNLEKNKLRNNFKIKQSKTSKIRLQKQISDVNSEKYRLQIQYLF